MMREKMLADALDAHVFTGSSLPALYQFPDAPPPPKLPPPPLKEPLSLLLEPPPDHAPPPPPTQPPRPPCTGAVMLSLNSVKTDATMPASAETISEPKTNHATSPIKPPVVSEPNSRPKMPRMTPPSTRMAMMVKGLSGLSSQVRSELCCCCCRCGGAGNGSAALAPVVPSPPAENPAGKVAAPELRRDDFVDDAFGGDIGQRALEAVADFDAKPAVVFGDHEDRAIVDLLASALPGISNPDRELLDGFRLCRRHDQHGNLAAFPKFQILQRLRQPVDITARQRSGLIDHAAGERRHRDIGKGCDSPAQQ